MRIEIFISILKLILVRYKKAYNKKYNNSLLYRLEMDMGICRYLKEHKDDLGITKSKRLMFLKTFNEYYNHLYDRMGFLFTPPFHMLTHSRYKLLKSRIEFLESEIKRLNRLQKKGYTHV